METILRFEKDVTFKNPESDYSWDSYEGYAIVTDKQTINIGVSSGQSCCEDFGYFTSEDDLSEFVGAEIRKVTITDTELKTGLAEKKGADQYYLDEGDIMFVNIVTDRGVLQFAAYNAHNGYYGHEGIVISNQVKDTKIL